MKVRLLLTLAAISCAVPALMAEEAMQAVKADQIVWKDDTLFKGPKVAILVGDPSKPELVVMRVKLPPNFKVPLHTHPVTEVLTVLSGALGQANSDTDTGEVYAAGSILIKPANHTHRVWTTDQETVIQLNFTGPMDITFVNPADDPRKK
jgi:quercetin dioxygenase-like cupin family protein